jgi:hypothetical protein
VRFALIASAVLCAACEAKLALSSRPLELMAVPGVTGPAARSCPVRCCPRAAYASGHFLKTAAWPHGVPEASTRSHIVTSSIQNLRPDFATRMPR